MSALSKILREAEGSGLLFWCPGCDGAHGIRHGEGGWGWNGNAEKPTFSPSILVKTTRFTQNGQADFDAWHAAGHPVRNGAPFESAPVVCHSFVTDGRIQFLSDCTHELAGQTVDLPEFPQGAET